MKKKKVSVVVLYGAMAVGKLTVGTVLSKKIGWKLTHNHLLNDLVSSVFERGTLQGNKILEKFRFKFYEEVVLARQNIIITHCYSHNYISPTGLRDPIYMKQLEKKLQKAGANVYFIHLKADKNILIERVKNVSRKSHKKLTSVPIMKEILKTTDFETSPKVKNNLVIDNSNLSPKKVVAIIEKYLNK